MVDVGNGAVIEQHARLVDVVTTRCGSQVAGLFAEPHISYGNGRAPARIDWYTRYDGLARPLGDLDSGSALAVQRLLTARLAALRPLCFDRDYGPLIAAALNLADSAAVLSIGGEPVLTDWGILPDAVVANDRLRAQQFSSTLGAYLPDFGLPPLSRAEWDNRFKASARLDAAPADAPRAVVATGAALPRSAARPSLLAPAIAALLAAAALAVFWIPGVLAFSRDAAPSTTAIATAQEVLRGLRMQRSRLDEAMLKPCTDLVNANAASPVVPPPIENVRVVPPAPPAVPGGPPVAPPTPSTFVSRVNDGTVLVTADDFSGSGFFIAPDFIITNRHVVLNRRRVRAASSVIGVIDAQVVAMGQGEYGDFALLKVAPQAAAKPFEIATIPAALQQVIAVGYPGVPMGTDPTFSRVINGDDSASRDLSPVTTVGPVNHLQPQDGGVTLIIHGAEISHGNSGGPLVDLCGRVVGVNTFGRNDDSVMWRYALGSDGLKSFVEGAGGTLRSATGACTPQVVSAEPPAAATPAPGAPPAPATRAPAGTPAPR